MTSPTEKITDRPLPSLAQWLGDGARAEDFEAWVSDMMSLEYAARATSPREEQTVRLLRTTAIAFVEAMRIEDAAGADSIDALLALARVSGIAVMGAVTCAVTDDAPLLKIAKMMAEEFSHGAKIMAHATIAKRAEP